MKKIFTFAAALLFGMSMMATEYEWEKIPGKSFNSEDNAVVVRAAENMSYEQKQMASDDASNKLWGIKIGSSANSNIDTAFVEIDCAGEITELEVGASNCSTSAGAKYVLVFCTENKFNGSDQTTLVPVEATSINRSVTSDNHQTITVPEGVQSLRIYRKVRINGTDYGAGTTVDIYYLKVTIGAASVRYTVSYMDNLTVLGTETVKEGEYATKYEQFQTKAHATFNGWYNDNGFTVAADFSEPITADKAFYGKWTAEEFVESTSIDIEQGVLDYGKGWDIKTAMATAHIAYDAKGNTDELDSLNASKDYNNEPYLGLKLKKKDAYIEVALNNEDTLRVKFGAVAAAFKVNIDGVESTMETSTANSVYELIADKAEYVRFSIVTDSKTVVFKQIMVNDTIQDIHMPAVLNDATLASLTLDGDTIEGFAAGKKEYTVTLAAGTTLPVVAATAHDANATVGTITQATTLPGDATFTVTAADGTTTATYTIHFVLPRPIEYLAAPYDVTNEDFSTLPNWLHGNVVYNGNYQGGDTTYCGYQVLRTITYTDPIDFYVGACDSLILKVSATGTRTAQLAIGDSIYATKEVKKGAAYEITAYIHSSAAENHVVFSTPGANGGTTIFGIKLTEYKDAPTGLWNNNAAVKATKAIINGKVVILKGGVAYDVLGNQL